MKSAPRRETRPDMAPRGRKGSRGTERGMAMLSSSISVEGVAWSISINHDTCFVVVVSDFVDGP